MRKRRRLSMIELSKECILKIRDPSFEHDHHRYFGNFSYFEKRVDIVATENGGMSKWHDPFVFYEWKWF